MRALLLLLVACGPSGSFRLQNRNYSADKILTTRLAEDAVEGLIVTLKSDPIASATDDEIAVAVSLFWNKDQRPALNQDVTVGSELAVRAVPRVSCFCGATDGAVTVPDVKGKLRLTRWTETEASGDFELTFTGQVPYQGGGVLFESDTLKVNASGFGQ